MTKEEKAMKLVELLRIGEQFERSDILVNERDFHKDFFERLQWKAREKVLEHVKESFKKTLSAKELDELIAAMSSPAIRKVMDFFIVNLSGEIKTFVEKNMESFLEECEEYFLRLSLE